MQGQHVRHQTATLAEIHVNELTHYLIVGHLNFSRKAAEQLFILLGGACLGSVLLGGALGKMLQIEVFFKLLGFVSKLSGGTTFSLVMECLISRIEAAAEAVREAHPIKIAAKIDFLIMVFC